MPVTYTNRKGQTYYLHHGMTKMGKPRYLFSKSAEGDLVEKVPEGYEIAESVNGVVSLCRSVARPIREDEVETVRGIVARYAHLKDYRVGAVQNAVVVYQPIGSISDDIAREMSGVFGPEADILRKIKQLNERYVQYDPVMRFVLVDKETRRFSVERMCYRSSIDGWLSLHHEGKLADLAARYVRHIGKESFFELF